jgi:hypothetical protein
MNKPPPSTFSTFTTWLTKPMARSRPARGLGKMKNEAAGRRLRVGPASGKYASLDGARRWNGIRGSTTLRGWIKQYGREDILPKRVRVETMDEIDELRTAHKPRSGLPLSAPPAAPPPRGTRRRGVSGGRPPVEGVAQDPLAGL